VLLHMKGKQHSDNSNQRPWHANFERSTHKLLSWCSSTAALPYTYLHGVQRRQANNTCNTTCRRCCLQQTVSVHACCTLIKHTSKSTWQHPCSSWT